MQSKDEHQNWDTYRHEIPRYRISLKKGYKAFFLAVTIVYWLLALMIGIAAIKNHMTGSDIVASLVCILFFLALSVSSMTEISRKCEAFKGKIVYSVLFKKKEYRLSEIAFSKTATEEIDVDHGDGMATNSWDQVTTFYDKQGKKLFKFGLAYNHVELLVKEVYNTNCSVKK